MAGVVGWLAGGALVIGLRLLTGEGFEASLAAAPAAAGAAVGLGEAAVPALGGVADVVAVVAVVAVVVTLPDAAAEATAGPTARHATANGASRTVPLAVRRRRGIERK